jgi:PAS domain S-box-containing protein
MPGLEARIVEGADDAIIYADAQGVIQLWNEAAARLFGYRPVEAVGRSLDLIVPEKHRQRHWEGYRRVMESGHTRYAGQLLAVPARHRDGRTISVEFTVTSIKEEDGSVEGIAGILRDVTARREEEIELRRRLRDAEGDPPGE